MSLVESLPYEVRREWPEEWDLLPLLCGDGELPRPLPARYMHSSLDVRDVEGKGRGVVATAPLEKGALLILDMPILTAGSHAALLQESVARAGSDEEFRRQLLSMCGDRDDEAARQSLEQPPSAKLARNILRHNYHGIDPAPRDGELTGESGVVGLWPLGSLVNHSLHPNVARCFCGHAICYRLIKSLKEGDEVLDNYLDMRLPHNVRQDMLQANHGMDDEGPDGCDGPAELVAEAREAYSVIQGQLEVGTEEAARDGFMQLLELTNKCAQAERPDPAFTDIFRDFAKVAGQFGECRLCLQGYAQAMEYATAREPFSMVSYALALRMVHMACMAEGDGYVEAQDRKQLEALAREHFRLVFGPMPGAFEALNPELAAMLQERQNAEEGASMKA